MRSAGWLAALLVTQCEGRVSFLGFPNNGAIAVSCQSSVTFPVGLSFAQTCIANNCAAPVTFTWNPDLTQYGVSLNQISPATLVINPNPLAVAKGNLTTTITASDQDGPGAVAPITINFDCPLMLGSQIPNQNATEGRLFSLDTSPFFSNPSRNLLTWILEGFPSANFAISPQGVISGIPAYTEASLPQPLRITVIATDSVTRRTVRSNTFDLQIAQKPGISFPSALGQIPAQNAVEGVLFQLPAGRYFNNPSNFAVVWSIMGGGTSQIDQTGTISVTPGVADLLAGRNQPISITVTGVDERGNVARSNPFTLTIKPLKLITNPISTPLPPVMCGSTCCSFNLSSFVTNPSSNPVQFTVTGIPFGSQLRAFPDGTVSGVTSMVDVRASPIVLMVTANNGDTSPTSLSPVIFSVTPMTAPILSTQTFPSRTVKINTNLQIDVTPYFVIPPSNTPTLWTLSSVSPSLTIDTAGRISGTLTEQDYLLQPSLILTVTASNKNACGGGMISQSFTVTIDPNFQGPNCNNGINGVPTNIVTCENTLVRVNLTKYCFDPKNLPLNYSITGLPSNSGLFLSNGILTGTPTAAASDVKSAYVTVCATNTRGLQDCLPSFLITFSRPKKAPIVDPPIPSPVTAIKGQRFVGYFNFHFFEPDFQPLIYSVAGLPLGSGMGIGPVTGIFSGIPNEADFRASPLVLSIFASNEQNVVPGGGVCQTTTTTWGGRARGDLIMIIQNPSTPPICRPLPPQSGTAQVGQFWATDVSRYFSPGEGSTRLEFALRSLPRGSGLSVDPKSGVISGVLTQQDGNYSPLSLVVAATNGYGSCQSTFIVTVRSNNLPPLPPFPTLPPVDVICPVSIQNILTQNSVEGTQFTIDLSQFISIPPQQKGNLRLTFISVGFPRGTGFAQASNGIFSGIPSVIDLDQGFLTIVTTVSCGSFGRPVTKQWQLIVSRRNNAGTGGSSCNACSYNNGGCQQQCLVINPQNCVPTCGCTAGFILNPDSKTCRSRSGCDQNNGGCGGVCSDQGMVPVCSCAQNWLLQADKQTCRYDPCGWNNGGCEQLCTSDGDRARCDCRAGALKSDGRTCSNDIIVVGTIPPALVIGCQHFIFDLSTAFSRQGGGALTFTVSGFPSQSGFGVTPSGLLSGTPTSADCAMQQPITIGIDACYGTTSVHAVMFMSAFCGTPNVCGNGLTPVVAPSTQPRPIPVMNANVCEPFRFDMAPYFTGGQGLVQFSVLGLPTGSGFQMSTQGVLSGVPTDCDCEESPLSITVVARDAIARTSKSVVTIRFSSCNCKQQQPPQFTTTTNQITSFSSSSRRIHNTAQCGQPFFLDCAEVFRVNGLLYTLTGLPANSGLRLSDTGVLSGTPNNADARSSPANVYITATDRFGTSEVLQVELEILGDCGGLSAPALVQLGFRSGSSIPAQDSNTGILPIQLAHRSQFFRLDLAKISFSGLTGKLDYEADGLPAGLSLSTAGLLAGIPSDANCQGAERPVKVTVRVNSLEALSSSHFLYIQILCDENPVSLPTLNGALPIASGTAGELFYYDTTPFLTTPTTDLSNILFECRGIATGSDLHITNMGILTGIPSAIDVNLPALLMSARDSKSGNLVQGTLRLLIREKITNNTAPVFVPLEVLTASAGKMFALNVAERFYDIDNDPLRFSASELSPPSGLKFNNQSGILSGVPNAFDTQQAQPVRIRVYAEDNKGGKTQGPIFITFSDVSKLNNAKMTTNLPPIISTGLNRDPVSIGIRRQVAIQGVPFLRSVASSFVDQDGDALSYILSGFPMGTGLAIDASGIISGTPNQKDADALQPLLLTITVKDGQGGSCEQDFLLTIFHSNSDNVSSVNHSPISQVIPDAVAYVDELLIARVSFHFADVDGDMLYYALTGLPEHTGLSISGMAGVISGTPTSADRAASPLLVSVMVSDGRGGIAQSSLRITVNPSRKSKKSLITRSMPRLNTTDGTKLNFVVSNYFQLVDVASNKNFLSFEMYGLPAQSGFMLDKTRGVFSGTPSVSDFSAKQPLVAGFVACDKQQQCLGNILFIDCFSSIYNSTTVRLFPDFVVSERVSSLGVIEVKFQVGTWGFFQSSRFFPSSSSSGSVNYGIAGLEVNSGLKFDISSGVIYGTPNLNDLIRADSCAGRCIPIVIDATGEGTTHTQTFVLKFILSRTDDVNHPPFARAIEKAYAEPKKMFLLDVWTNFVDPDGDPLGFTVLGLPPDSGFAIIATSGVFFGVPSMSDLLMRQPAVLTIVADDQKGGKVQETLSLTFTSPPSIPALPTSASSVAVSSPPRVSVKTCDELPTFVTAPSALNKAVCSSAAVGTSTTCSGRVTFLKATQLCAQKSARLCTAAEMSQDIGNDQECGYGPQRTWSSSECAVDGQVFTQAGSSAFLREIPKNCTSITDLLPVYCCADQKDGDYFQNLQVTPSKNAIMINWSWKLYPTAQISYRKSNISAMTWVTPQAGRSIPMAGDVSFNLQGLDVNSNYVIRVTPLDAKNRVVQRQIVEFRASTVM